jgi:hypothetical protein
VLGLIVLALVIAPLLVVVLFVPERHQLTAAVASLGVLLAGFSYAMGRARSRALPLFHPKERVAALGAATLGNPLGVASMILLVLAVLVVLLPGQFGSKDAGPARGAKPPKSIKTPVRIVEIPYGILTTVDDRRWMGVLNTNKKSLASLQATQPAPKGYHWVLYFVQVTPLVKKAEFYAASTSLKLVDDQGNLLLPDYGAGIINADQSYVRQNTRPYWTVGYLLKDGRKPASLQLELFPGIDQILSFRPATRLEFCQQFQEARLAEIKAKRKPRPLPADCPSLLQAQKERTQAEQSSPSNPATDAKTTAPGQPNEPTS